MDPIEGGNAFLAGLKWENLMTLLTAQFAHQIEDVRLVVDNNYFGHCDAFFRVMTDLRLSFVQIDNTES
ncbi:MAG: hypothetical protein IT576_09455 [Verrucomicrobiales bacterium]|nr:hypothetical protein [Verrucomicrobiales bacterium]